MKKIFVFFLCCSTLLYGCYPYSALTREELITQKLLPEEDMIATLVDGSVIKSQPYHHIYTTEPGNFIYGSGKWEHRFIRGEQLEFVGKLQRASIDSLKVIGVGTQSYLICYLPDSTDIYYRDRNYIIVTPDQSPGLWCAGIHNVDGKESVFSGRIPQERIERVEMKKFNTGQTIGLAAVVTVSVVGVAVLAIISSSISSFQSSFHVGNLNSGK